MFQKMTESFEAVVSAETLNNWEITDNRMKVHLLLMAVILLPGALATDISLRAYTQTDGGNSFEENIGVSPGKTATIYFQLKNDDRIVAENIHASARLEGMFEEDVIEEYSDFDVQPGRSEVLQFSFAVPGRIEAKKYPLLMEAKGEIGNALFSVSENFFVVVEKPGHEIRFEQALFQESTVRCKENAVLYLQLRNYGEQNESPVINVKNEPAGVSMSRTINVAAYPGQDEVEEVLVFPSPEESGVYTFFVIARTSQGALATASPVLRIECDSSQAEEEGVAATGSTEAASAPIKEEASIAAGKNSSVPIVIQKNPASRLSYWVFGILLLSAIGVVAAVKKANA